MNGKVQLNFDLLSSQGETDLPRTAETLGPRGLLTRLRRAYLVESSGGVYENPELLALNHAGPYLEHVMRFLGVPEVLREPSQES